MSNERVFNKHTEAFERLVILKKLPRDHKQVEGHDYSTDLKVALKEIDRKEKQPNLSEVRQRFNAFENNYSIKSGKEKKEPLNLLKASKNAVHLIKTQWEQIQTFKKPAERTAALEFLKKESGLGPKGFNNVVLELIAEENEDNKKYKTFGALKKSKDLKSEPLIDRLLPKGRTVLLAADGGTGKSTLGYEIAEAISNGGKLFGQLQAQQGRVLIYQCDEPPVDADTKADVMDLSLDEANHEIQWDFNPSMVPDMEQKIIKEKWDLVILDSFTKIFGQGSDMNTPEVGLYVYELNKVASRTGATILLPHHLNRNQAQKNKKQDGDKENFRRDVSKDDLYGSVFIFNGCSDVWGLWIAGKHEGQKLFHMKYLKTRSMIAPSNHLYQFKGNDETLRYEMILKSDGDIDDAETIEKAVLILLKQHIGEKFSINQIYQKIPKCRDSKDYLGQVVSRIYRNRDVTGVGRCRSPHQTGGRPSFLYFKR